MVRVWLMRVLRPDRRSVTARVPHARRRAPPAPPPQREGKVGSDTAQKFTHFRVGNKKLKFDGKTETFADCPEANKFIKRESYRKPWVVPDQ